MLVLLMTLLQLSNMPTLPTPSTSIMSCHTITIMTNAPNQLDDIIWANITEMNTQLDTQFNKFNTQLDTQFDKLIVKLDNYKSIAKLDNYTNTATDNIVGDNRLLTDIEIREHAYKLLLRCDQLFDMNDG